MTKLVFTGDVMLGRLINDYLKTVSDPALIWGDTLEELRSADATFINLECALTQNSKRGHKESPVFFFRSQPNNVHALLAAGIDFCSLANNHVLDFGTQGLLDTLKTLSNVGIAYSGAGENIEKAKSPAKLKINNLLFSVYSITDNEAGWKAEENKPGTFFLPIDTDSEIVQDFFKQVSEEKRTSDFVIVSSHWGPNMVRVPTFEHQQFAHAVVDAGCDIFHGHSSHVFQGVEIYKKSVIFYDCGEAVDDYAVDPVLRNDESFVFEVYLNEAGIEEVVLKPTLIKDLRVNFVKGDYGVKISQKMSKLCKEFNTPVLVDQEVLKI